jgi:hypothetical protein
MKYVAIERVRRDDALDCLAILQHRIHFRFKLPHHRGQAACRGSVRRNRTPFHYHLKFETPVISRRLRPHPRRKHRRSRFACESDFASGHSAERQWNLRRASGRGGLRKWRSHRRNDRRLELLRRWPNKFRWRILNPEIAHWPQLYHLRGATRWSVESIANCQCHANSLPQRYYRCRLAQAVQSRGARSQHGIHRANPPRRSVAIMRKGMVL